MKQVLTHESKWPIQPLDKDDRIKDVEEALLFGNHKGAVKQQDLLVKLVTDNTEHEKHRVWLFARSVQEIEDLRSNQMEALRASLLVERFPPRFDLSDPNVQPLLHPEVKRVCEMFPMKAEEIVKRYGLDSDESNCMLEETRGNPIFRWRVQKC